MKATNKDSYIESLLTAISGRDRVQCIAERSCTCCGSAAYYFEDELSKKEYTISGMCQNCQNVVFGNEDN